MLNRSRSKSLSASAASTAVAVKAPTSKAASSLGVVVESNDAMADDRPYRRDQGQTKDRSRPHRLNMREMIGRSMSLHPSGRRRICPATMEATRLALAARAEYSRARVCKPLEKAAFLIVTKDGGERLDELEMAVINLDHRKQQARSKSSRSEAQKSTRETKDLTHDDQQRNAGGSDSTDNQQMKSSRIRWKSTRVDDLGSSRSSGRRHCHLSTSMSTEAEPYSLPGSPPDHRLSTEKVPSPEKRTEVISEDIALRDISSSSSVHLKRAPTASIAWQETPALSSEDVTTAEGRRPEAERGLWDESATPIIGASSSKASVLRLAAAGAIMLTGSCAFVGSYVVGRRESWKVLGSTIMSLSCLLLVIGVCCYLANTQPHSNRSNTGPGGCNGGSPVEIRVVDERQLAKFMKMGVHVETLTV